MISVVVTCRVEGNHNSDLVGLLNSLSKFCASPTNFEVLVKFDDDDPLARNVANNLPNYRFPVKCCFGPRLRGYIDIHHGYAQAFQMADPNSTVVGAMADDFKAIVYAWDAQILEASRQYKDNIFFLHGRPHPWCNYVQYREGCPFLIKDMYFIPGNAVTGSIPLPQDIHSYRQDKFFMDWKFEEMDKLYIIDEAPFWGREVVNICDGFGPISFTDAWTLVLEHLLWNRHGIKRTVFLEEEFITRKVVPEIDCEEAPRWNTDRAYNFNYIKSPEFMAVMEKQAADVAARINHVG
jgi:hypothetical protein